MQQKMTSFKRDGKKKKREKSGLEHKKQQQTTSFIPLCAMHEEAILNTIFLAFI